MTVLDHVEWRYLPGGRVRHALRYIGDLAYCGANVRPFEEWRGTGSQAEYERVAAMPNCRRCVAKMGGAS